jgi:AcrR family transcriptional regulator
MTQSRRERLHEATCQEIKAIAWEQIAAQGAASLSLRAIASQMGMTSPALYRYFASRDDLVTALIVDAFTSLGEALAAARDALPSEEHAGRYAATGYAYREWALAYPGRYALIFGSPISGYVAPLWITQPVAAQSLGVLIGVLEAAWDAGALRLPSEYTRLPPAILEQLKAWREQTGITAPEPVLCLALISWSRVHGLVSLELYRQFPPAISDYGALFHLEIQALQRQAGFLHEQDGYR